MKTLLVALAACILALCTAQSQSTITLQPHLKKGDKITMTTISYMENTVYTIEKDKAQSDSVILHTYFEVIADTVDQYVFAVRYNVDLENTKTMAFLVKDFAKYLPNFEFIVTKNGSFVGLKNEQKIIADYRSNLKERTLNLVAFLAHIMAQNQTKDNSQKTAEDFSETVTAMLLNMVDEHTILHIARMQAQFIFPFAGKTLELGKTVTDISALHTTDMPFDIRAQRTYILNEIKDNKANITLENMADQGVFIDSLMGWLKRNNDLMYKIGRNVVKNGQLPDKDTLEKQRRELMKDVKLFTKNDYTFDLKIGLPISYIAKVNMSGVPKAKNQKLYDVVTFELKQ